MKAIPMFPDFAPICFDMVAEFSDFCEKLESGISEFITPNLFFDSKKYTYVFSRLSQNALLLKGVSPEPLYEGQRGHSPFFSLLSNHVDMELFDKYLNTYLQEGLFWKNMSEEHKHVLEDDLSRREYTILEDRNNFDYLYSRTDLAQLQGKAFHKKKNLVNAFTGAYESETKKLDVYTIPDALSVLESWKKMRTQDEDDYKECCMALEKFTQFSLSGIVVYAQGIPVGFSIGQCIQQGTMFVTLFEKALNGYKGVYQFVNRSQALHLPPTVEIINREQDLGDEGLRQAKMTYRPVGFTKKYVVCKE